MSPKRALTLRAELTNRGLTFEQAAVLGGIRESTVSRIIAGKVHPERSTVVALAKALGISAARMQGMCHRHWLDAHPEEDVDADEVA